MMSTLRKGDRVKTVPLIFKSYSYSSGLGVFVSEEDNETIELPLSLPVLGLGPYGVDSFMHPTDLPLEHPDCCIWFKQSKALVSHRRTDQVCILHLQDDFHVTGGFSLTPINSRDLKHCTSKEWSKQAAISQLDSNKGASFELEFVIESFIYRTKQMSTMLLMDSRKEDLRLLVTSSRWPLIFSISASIIRW